VQCFGFYIDVAALLHLCNENTLALESMGDQFADFKITKG